MANSTDHYRLQYNLPSSWSLKYNMAFQYILDIPVFPASVMEMEIAYYRSQQLNTYGVPLDVR